MKCIYCGDMGSKVLDSRLSDDGSAIRRRRECALCGKRFTTYERVEIATIYVIKKSGNRQPFDPEKIKSGIYKACEKRPVPVAKVDALVADIIRNIYNLQENEITTSAIGDMVMRGLKELDDVAYVRFASVYKQFRDINSLMDEIRLILDKKNKNI